MKFLFESSAHRRFGISAALSAWLLVGCGGGSASTASSSPAPATTLLDSTVWLKDNAHIFASTDPADEDYSDLADFGDAIGDASIVTLAEPDHGSGTVFDMKTRLVKYLHEKKGFDVLVMESDLFAISRIWQLAQGGQKVDDLAPGNIFYMYSKSMQGRKALQYVDSQRTTTNPLFLTSFGRGLNANYAVNDEFPTLETFLNGRGSTITASTDWATYKDVALKDILSYPPQETIPSQARIDAFHTVATQLESELCATQADTYVFPDSPGLWCRMIKTMDTAGNVAFGSARPSANEVEYAANVQWLLEHPYAGHKIIIWGHYAHVGRGTQAGFDVNMGSELARIYGNKMYVATFTSSLGTELMWANWPASTVDYAIPADSPGSVEGILHQLNKPDLFIDARAVPPPSSLGSVIAKETNYASFYSRLGSAYDGLLYIETSAPATMNR